MLKISATILLCFFYFSIFAQEEIIIDNGYLSFQGWGGNIHPSGDYYVRGDRTVIHAYSRKNGMLFKTYKAECISQGIQFSKDGNYMIITTSGEMGVDCERVIIFDFFSGELLFNEKGAACVSGVLFFF